VPRSWFTSLLVAFAFACGDPKVEDTAPAGPEPIPPEFAALHERVLVPSCASGGCHSTADAIADLALEDIDEAYDALLNQPCTNQTAIIEGLLRVMPGAPEDSFLYLKVTDAQGMGTEMPPAEDLTAEEQEAIAEWISIGAPR
jgi:hypothetical protein